MKKYKIFWFFGPKEYLYSGLGLYSDVMINKLSKEKHNINIIRRYIILKANNPFRYIYQLLIMPIMITLFYRNNRNIFTDESFLLLTLVPFFPYKNSTIIIHDYRDFKLTNKTPGFFENIYFKILTKSYKNLSKFKKVIASSEFTKKTLLQNFDLDKNKIKVVNNSFDFNDNVPSTSLKELLTKYNIPVSNSTKVVLSVSSEEDRKNIPVIIRAMKKIKDKNIIFVKIGKPIIKSNSILNKKLIKDLDIDDRIYFIDKVSYNDIINFYKCSHVLVFPTSFEGFGRPPIEAQMNNLPVIASSIEVLKDNLGDSVMYLDDETSPIEIVMAIERMLNDDDLRLSYIKKGMLNCQRFNIDNNYQKFYEVLKDIKPLPSKLKIAWKTSVGTNVLYGNKFMFSAIRLLQFTRMFNKFIFNLSITKYVIKNKVGKFLVQSNNDSMGKSSEYFEYRTQDYFDTKDNDIFIDIGANIGFYSIYTSNVLGYNKVYSFEPNPKTFKTLHDNIILNELGAKVELFNYALGDKEDTLHFWNDKIHTGRSRFVQPGEIIDDKYNEILQIPTSTFDNFVKSEKIDIDRISLIKIDVEEFDTQLLYGMKESLSKFKAGTKIFIEIHEHSKSKEILKNNGFVLLKQYCGNCLYIKIEKRSFELRTER